MDAPGAGLAAPEARPGVRTENVVQLVVASRDPLVRAGLRALLEAALGVPVAAEADLSGLGAALLHTGPAVVVAELGSDTEVAELAAALEETPGVGLVALAGDTASSAALGLLAGRPVALLERTAEAERVRVAVEAVRQGLHVMDPALGLAAQALARAARRGTAPAEELTPREREVLQLMAGGLPTKGIGQRLGISEHTVKFHIGSILGKLGAANRAEAVAAAVRQGLLLL